MPRQNIDHGGDLRAVGRALTSTCAPLAWPACICFTSASRPPLWPYSRSLTCVGSSSRGSPLCCCSAVGHSVVLERLAAIRCVVELHVLHYHARSGASGLGRRLGGPAATCGAISQTLTSCVRHPCSAAAAHLHRAACRAIRAAAGAAQAWVLQMACVRCAWRARGRRGRPAGALASVVQGGLLRASAPRGECAGLVSSVLWDRLTATRRSVLLMVLRLGACGTITGGGMTVASLEVACRWPVG